jgi:hypothetical protein
MAAIYKFLLRLAKSNLYECRKINCSKHFFHTPDRSGKPLSEARSLERIAGKRSKKKVRKVKRR